MALDPRRLDVAVRRQRHDDAPSPRHLCGAVGQRFTWRSRAEADHGSRERSTVHRQGGRGRLCDRRPGRLRPGRLARTIPTPTARLAPVDRCLANCPNPCGRTHGRRVGEPEAPGQPQDWGAVALIAAFLTFFPVTVNTIRGLHSADRRALELMRSYAAGDWRILWKLRFPAALPYIFAALKISATASVVGALIGQLPSSI